MEASLADFVTTKIPLSSSKIIRAEKAGLIDGTKYKPLVALMVET